MYYVRFMDLLKIPENKKDILSFLKYGDIFINGSLSKKLTQVFCIHSSYIRLHVQESYYLKELYIYIPDYSFITNKDFQSKLKIKYEKSKIRSR